MVDRQHIEEVLSVLPLCFMARSELFHHAVDQYLKTGGDHGSLNSQGDQSHGSRCLVPTLHPSGSVDGAEGHLSQEDETLGLDSAETEAQAA